MERKRFALALVLSIPPGIGIVGFGMRIFNDYALALPMGVVTAVGAFLLVMLITSEGTENRPNIGEQS